jgi:hypothetical protein
MNTSITGELQRLDSEELLRRLTAELTQLHDSGAGMRVEMHPATAFAVVAMCQLALRHPGTLTNASRELVQDFIQMVRGKFAPYAPALAEAIRRGDHPENDSAT